MYPFFARRVTSAPWFSRYLTISLFLWKTEKARVRPTERESTALLLGNMSGGFNYSSISAPVKGLGKLCLPALVPYTVGSHDRNQSLSAPSTIKTKTKGSAPKVLAPRTTCRPCPSSPKSGLLQLKREASRRPGCLMWKSEAYQMRKETTSKGHRRLL